MGVEVKSKGTIRLHNIKRRCAMRRGIWSQCRVRGELGVVDEFGRERERYKIPYGATITVNDADPFVAAGQSGRELGSAYSPPWSRKVAGMIKFSDFVRRHHPSRPRWTM